DRAVVADAARRGGGVVAEVPARIADEAGDAVELATGPQEGVRVQAAVRADRPALVVDAVGAAVAGTRQQRDRAHAAGLGPDEGRALALVLHAGADDIATVADSERERAVLARQRADVHRRVGLGVEQHALVAGLARQVEPEPDDQARI